MLQLNTKQARVLNRIQQDLPVNDQIYHQIAKDTSLKLKETFDIIRELKELDIISSFSADISKRKAKFHSGLIALKIPQNDFNNKIQHIIKHPNISWCYTMENIFNVWTYGM